MTKTNKTAGTFQVGDAVICNGFRGTVREVLAERGMVVVKLPGGLAQVDASDELEIRHAAAA